MLGIVRGTLCTACQSIVGDFSTDARTKLRRVINEDGPGFCQLSDWAFLHSVITFSITDGTTSYAGSGYLPQTFSRFQATKIKDSNNNYSPIEEKSVSWYAEIEDPAYEGTPHAVVLRGIDSNGYPKAYFYYTPDTTYTFEADIDLKWTDIAETSAGDASRCVVTEDCLTAFKYWVARGYGIAQGDDSLIARCERILFGDRAARMPGLIELLKSKQRGAHKLRGIRPSSAYKSENYLTSSDYGRRSP